MKKGRRPVTVTIDGQQINITLAKITYRCEICGGMLTRTNNRLHCSNPNHRGLIHRNEAKKRTEQQRENIKNLPYKIVNGKVIYDGN